MTSNEICGSNKRQKPIKNIWDAATNTLIYCGKKIELDDDGTSTINGETQTIRYVRTADWLRSIDEKAFRYHRYLEYVEITSQVEYVGKSAFGFCTHLRHVIFSESSNLKSIGAFSFYKCTNLESITIPDSVNLIYVNAFQIVLDWWILTFPKLHYKPFLEIAFSSVPV